MRNEDEIQDRIRYLISQELDSRFAKAKVRLPHKCKHNHHQPMDFRRTVLGDKNPTYNRVSGQSLPVVGLCMLGADDPKEWSGTICEDPIDAQRCPYYDPLETKESIQTEFETQIQDLDWVRQNMSEVYGLLWALGSEKAPKLPWWKRVWYHFLTVRPDPLVPTPQLPAGGGDA